MFDVIGNDIDPKYVDVPAKYRSAVPFNTAGTSADPPTSGLPSPIVVFVCGSPYLVVNENTSTSPTLSATYSVPAAS